LPIEISTLGDFCRSALIPSEGEKFDPEIPQGIEPLGMTTCSKIQFFSIGEFRF